MNQLSSTAGIWGNVSQIYKLGHNPTKTSQYLSVFSLNSLILVILWSFIWSQHRAVMISLNSATGYALAGANGSLCVSVR